MTKAAKWAAIAAVVDFINLFISNTAVLFIALYSHQPWLSALVAVNIWVYALPYSIAPLPNIFRKKVSK